MKEHTDGDPGSLPLARSKGEMSTFMDSDDKARFSV